MAAKSFLRLVAGRVTQILGVVVSAGAGNNGDIPALDSTGKLDSSVMPVGIGAETKSIVTSENLAAGDFVNVYSNAGTPTARKADATASGKEVDGFVLAGTTSPAAAVVYLRGINTQLTGLTGGTRYYLATTPGTVVATPPSGSGNVVQFLGKALSATEISVKNADGIILA